MPAEDDLAALAAPVFHVYRVVLQGLTSVLCLLVPTARTPFTCLLDAAEAVWVLDYTVA